MADAVYGADAPDSQTDPQSSDEGGPTAAESIVFPQWLTVVDKLFELRCFLECAYMAAGHLHPLERDPLQFVLGHVSVGMSDLAKEVRPSPKSEENEVEDD